MSAPRTSTTGTTRTGGCMCGAVRFVADSVPDTYGACHCEMCRRWAGSAMLTITVPESGLSWTGEAHIRTLQSSDWAERAWCQRCGSGLYYRVTADGPMSDALNLPIGLLDDTSGLSLAREFYTDHKAHGVDFAGDHSRMTRAETLAAFGIEDGGAA